MPKPSQTNIPPVSEVARNALPMMARHRIEPTPRNYAVWYAYVAGSNKPLNEEINGYIRDKRPFTDELNDYLYERFVADNIDKQVMEQATAEAKLIMENIAKLIDSLTGDASQYGQEVDSYIEDLTSNTHNKELQAALKTIASKTRLLKDKGAVLSRRLETTSSEVRSLKRDLEKVSLEAQKDFLTGVDNRKAFDTHLEERISQAREEHTPLALIIIDIDYFKKFNDKFGHQIGDEVLKQVSRILMDSVKGQDRVARYGGEEFAIILPNTPLAGGLAVAENLRKAIAAKTIRRKDTGETLPTVTISLGVAALHPKDKPEHLIKRADDALYMSKSGGRNKVTQESNP